MRRCTRPKTIKHTRGVPKDRKGIRKVPRAKTINGIKRVPENQKKGIKGVSENHKGYQGGAPPEDLSEDQRVARRP